MDDFFFVKIEGLKFVTAEELGGFLDAVRPWIQGEARFYLCTTPAQGEDANVVVITGDKLYFMEVAPPDFGVKRGVFPGSNASINAVWWPMRSSPVLKGNGPRSAS